MTSTSKSCPRCHYSTHRGNDTRSMPLIIFWALLLVTQSHLSTSSRFRYFPGYFLQGHPSQPVPASYPPRMGLIDGKTWHDVQAVISTKQSEGAQLKLVIFLRHGEGIHNAAINKYGGDAWDAYYCKLPEYLDAPLTPLGIRQAEKASTTLNGEVDEGLLLDHVLVSPLERALKTFTVAYQNQSANINRISLELPREVLGVHTCDERRNISEKEVQYPLLKFSGFETDADPWWTPNHRETDTEIETRAAAFLNFIFHNMSVQSVGVVSHKVFGAALLRVIGHREYSLGTAEFLPLLIEKVTSS